VGWASFCAAVGAGGLLLATFVFDELANTYDSNAWGNVSAIFVAGGVLVLFFSLLALLAMAQQRRFARRQAREPNGTPPPHGWGPQTLSRVLATLGCLVVCSVFALLALSARQGDRLGGTVLLVAVLVGWWLFCMRPRVTLTATEVVIRNPLKTRRLALRDITGASTDYSGLTLRLRGGETVCAWAVQKSNFADWMGWDTRADLVADAVLAQVATAREARQQDH